MRINLLSSIRTGETGVKSRATSESSCIVDFLNTQVVFIQLPIVKYSRLYLKKKDKAVEALLHECRHFPLSRDNMSTVCYFSFQTVFCAFIHISEQIYMRLTFLYILFCFLLVFKLYDTNCIVLQLTLFLLSFGLE